MSDVSKAVADRMRISRTVIASQEVHGPEVAEALGEVLFPDGPPEQVTVEVFLGALGKALSRAVDELSGADIAHAAELADDAEPREKRDAATIELREQLIGARSGLETVYGPAVVRAYGLAGQTPETSDLLIQYAATAAGLLETRPLTDKPKRPGIQVSIEELAIGIRKTAKDLSDALGAVKQEEREAQLTLKRKNHATTMWSARYQGVADVLTGLYELTEQAELAERVRPTARRRAGLPEEEDLTTGGTPL